MSGSGVFSDHRVAIAWHGLPLYAASAIAAAIGEGRRPIDVIATRPLVPAEGMEEVIRQPVMWIEAGDRPTFRSWHRAVPRVLFISGWSVPSFRSLAGEVKRAGGRVVGMVDNSFRGDLRQCVGAVAYRVLYRSLFDHVWVPGRAATRLMQFYGVPRARISQGLYTCDSSIFRHTAQLVERPCRFTFAGQLTERKNVTRLCRAFIRFHEQGGSGCELEIFGSGPLRESLPRHSAIRIHDFAMPARLAVAFNESRCLVLPSVIDHWGVVVHEAASCGMLLIVSDSTGAAEDLCAPANSRIIRADSEDDLVAAFRWAAAMSRDGLAHGSRTSLELAGAFSTRLWVEKFHGICDRLESSLPHERHEVM